MRASACRRSPGYVRSLPCCNLVFLAVSPANLLSFQEELFAFHEAHFSHFSVVDFGATFTGLTGLASENDDARGHGEPATEHAVEADVGAEAVDGGDDAYAYEVSEDLYAELPDMPAPFAAGESLADNLAVDAKDKQPRKKRRRKKTSISNNNNNNDNNTGNGHARRLDAPKPDLRKRTWDVVESGLGSLDYDGAEQNACSMPSAPQRRRVQYDDD